MLTYKKLSEEKKIIHHKNHLKKAKDISSIISAQSSCVCIRNIKQASAHNNSGINVHLYFSGKSPNDFYGFGNDYYKSITKVSKKTTLFWKYKIEKLIHKTNAQLIHSHNEPDILPMKMMQFDLGIPIIYDQHDFLSAKRTLSSQLLNQEKYCNENNNGAIFITDKYKNLVSNKYAINPLNISFPNYGSKDLLIKKDSMIKKISDKTGAIHLVYEGALDEKNPNITRYLVPQIKQLSELGFYIDLFPSKNNSYDLYKKMTNVTVHDKLPPNLLIKKLSQYDFGLSIVNQNCDNIPEELKYGFWNKCFDYLLAGIPQITLKGFDIINDFVEKNKFGFSIDDLSKLKNNENLSHENQEEFANHIFSNRDEWLIENNLNKMHLFYIETIKKYHTQKIEELIN